MEPITYIAHATKDYTNLLLLINLLIGVLIFIFLINRKKIRSITGIYRQIGLLLGGLISLILIATTLFTAWHLYTLQPVSLSATHLTSYHGQITYKEIKRVGIYNGVANSFINPQIVVRESNILVVEKRDKRTFLFSEENYNIQELIREIKKRME